MPGTGTGSPVDDVPLDEQYAPAHDIAIEPGSLLASLAGGTTARVNSLHGQGIHRLADGLKAVAHAPDGQIEAIEVPGATGFALAVQWHPEWRCWENGFYSAIFRAFGDACAHHARRSR